MIGYLQIFLLACIFTGYYAWKRRGNPPGRLREPHRGVRARRLQPARRRRAW